jgi:hypothetical protein
MRESERREKKRELGRGRGNGRKYTSDNINILNVHKHTYFLIKKDREEDKEDKEDERSSRIGEEREYKIRGEKKSE